MCSSAPVSDHTSPVSTPQPEPADSRNIRIGDSISARTSPAPSSLLAPRRFLLSRPPSAPPSILAGSGGIKSRKRKKDNVAVFVEQRVAPLLRVEEASGFVEEGEKEERKLKRPNSHAVKIQKPKSEDVSEPVVSGEGEKIEQNKVSEQYPNGKICGFRFSTILYFIFGRISNTHTLYSRNCPLLSQNSSRKRRRRSNL